MASINENDDNISSEKESNAEKKRALKAEKKSKKKYMKEGVSIDDLRLEWTQCYYFIKKKKRLCNMQKAADCVYCPVHRSDVAASGGDSVNKHWMAIDTSLALSSLASSEFPPDSSHISVNEDHIRVPCPIEPTHSVYKHKLAEHVKKCNTKTRYETLEKFAYYCKDCNTGSNTEVFTDGSLVDTTSHVVDPDALLQKVENLYTSIQQDIHPIETEALNAILLSEDRMVKDLSGNKSSYTKVRHAYQDILLIKNMILAELLTVTSEVTNSSTSSTVATTTSASIPTSSSSSLHSTAVSDNTTTFIELGAGKGLLGLAVASAQRGSAEETQGEIHIHQST